jgi:hypothetical protein
MAARMAARSTTAGTPVKSCISTRAGRYWISRSERRSPARGEGAQVVAGDGLAVFPAQQVFQQHLQRHGQALQVAQLAGGFGRLK